MMRYFMMPALCALIVSLAGCGGGGGGNSASETAAAPTVQAQNVLPVKVELGPGNNVNIPYATVTICSPGGSASCQTIDHVLVDTGSNGLRIFASELSPALSLGLQPAANGNTLVECMPFVDGYTWGPVKVADVQLAGLRASSVNVQVIGDPAFSTVPADCAAPTDTSLDSVAKFGARGVLGVGLFAEDCGSGCAQIADNTIYYSCTSSSCVSTTVVLAKQVQNPVSRFSSDNNGVVLKMPSVPAAGAATASGSLVLGIGTRTNNALGSEAVFAADPYTGYITTVYNNKAYAKSFIDSGSNGIFFQDSGIPLCSSGFYCPPSMQNRSATNFGTTGTSGNVAFTIANADQLFSANSTYTAFSTLAGSMSNPSSFDWGLPFFYGRTVFTAIEDRATPAGNGPYFAY